MSSCGVKEGHGVWAGASTKMSTGASMRTANQMTFLTARDPVRLPNVGKASLFDL